MINGSLQIKPASKGWEKGFQGLEKNALRVPSLGIMIWGALLACSLAAGAQEVAPVAVAAVEKTPAEKLIEQAQTERADGNPKQAIQTAVKVLTLEGIEKETLAQCELLIAELYLEQGMTNAASVTARQIQVLYEGSQVVGKADVLRLKIEKLKEGAE
jgi:outer membrane protein assembly factor BamD (BamD/ComL family)